MNVQNATKTIKQTLGAEAKETFEDYVEELTCYVRSLSLVDFLTPESIVKSNLLHLCRQAIVVSVKSFLTKKYEEDCDLQVAENTICDADMKPIPEIVALREKQDEIVETLLSFTMEEFQRGRLLGAEIVSRAQKYVSGTVDVQGSQPLRETLEIEVIRLEAQLPDLSTQEVKKLCDCYRELRKKDRACVGSS